MNALPGYRNVFALPHVPVVASNNTADPAEQRRELDEAAPFWTDMDEPHVNTRYDAPQWQWRDENGRIIPGQFPPLKSQREIDDESGPNLAAWLVMFSAAAAVALIMAGFDWLMGVM